MVIGSYTENYFRLGVIQVYSMLCVFDVYLGPLAQGYVLVLKKA